MATQTKTAPTLKMHRWPHVAFACALVGLCAMLYAWTLDFPMEFDDAVYLQNNPLVQNVQSFGYLGDLHEFVTRPMKLGLEPDLATNFIMRPVAYATFHLNYLLDGFNPRWFRAVNVVVHAANGWLIYALLNLLLGRAGVARQSSLFIAATAALLFTVHPLATESVTYIVQRFTSLGAFFYLLALWLYFTSHSAKQRTAQRALLAASVVTVVLGMLTNEAVVTAPLLALFLDRWLLGIPMKTALRRAFPLLLCLPIIPTLVVLTTWAKHDGVFHLADMLNITNSIEAPLDHHHFRLSQLTVITAYLRLLVWPTGLNLDPEWPLHRTLLEWPVLRSLLVLGMLIAAAWFVYRRNPRDGRLTTVFAFTIWFFATIAVSSGLITLPDLMAEHRCYLPSVGIFAVIACLSDRWRMSGPMSRWLAPTAVAACVLALSWTTCNRNEVWRSKIALWEDTAAKSPGKFRVWNNLGDAYHKGRRLEDAVRCFQQAKEKEPRSWAAYVNLAASLNGLTRYEEAFQTIVELVKTHPDAEMSAEVRYNCGLAHIGLGRTQRGMDVLEELIGVIPYHRPSRVVLGLVYSQTSQPAKALEHWRHALALLPTDTALEAAIRNLSATIQVAGN